MSIKPCKGCFYFRRAIFGPYCTYHANTVRKIEPYSGDEYLSTEGEIQAKKMRSPEGECGPERRLYISNWGAVKKAASILINRMRKKI